MSDGKGDGASAFLWTVGLGAVAIGGYWLYAKKQGGAPVATSAPPPLELQAQGPAAATAAPQQSSFADGALPSWPDLSGFNALFQPAQGGVQQGVTAPDRYATSALYQYDPWHPSAFVLSNEGVKVLAGAPLNGYLLDHEGPGAVFHGMSSPATSNARNDATLYNGSATIRATADAGKASIFLGKLDLDEMRFGRFPSTLIFASTEDANAWLASKNSALFNVRVRPTNEPLPPVYATTDGESVATPYGAKLFNDATANAYAWKTLKDDPVPGSTQYITAGSFTAQSAKTLIANARAQGLMVYANVTEMDALADNPTRSMIDFYLVWPGTVMPAGRVRIF